MLENLNFIQDKMIHLASSSPSNASGTVWIDILIILILVFINGFFSASEMAIVTLNDAKLKKEAADGNKAAKKILHFVSNPSAFLATIQVGVTLAGFLSSAFAGDKFAGRIMALIDPSGRYPQLRSLAVIIVTLLVAYISLVLGELVPKRLALNNPEKFSKKYIGLLRIIDSIFKPFTKLLTFSTNIILKLLRISPQTADKKISEEEIRMMVDVGLTSGTIHVDESRMIQNVFEFNDKEVSEIMKHRTNIVALNINASLDEVVDVAINEKYSRIPIYDEDIDDICGILTIRDLLFYTAKNKVENFSLKDILRPPYRVPESKHVDALFRDMQKERVSMAIVIDEYGGTAGLVTVEDLLEEIVGNIEDEYDDENENISIVKRDEGLYEIDGLESLDDVKKVIPEALFNDDDYEDFDTIAGLVLDCLGYIPEENEHPEARRNNMKFKVLSMEDNRIEKIQLNLLKMDGKNDLNNDLNQENNDSDSNKLSNDD